MYPYNRKTQLYSTPIRAKERMTTQTTQTNQATQTAPLSSDRRLQELLTLARQELAQLEQKYEALLADERLTEARELIQSMQTDGKKHQRILRELLFTIFSDTVTDILEDILPADLETTDPEALLEELLFAEMDDISFFRDLLFAMEEEELWEMLFEIILDKQNHTAALNHLYAKYFTKNAGN